MSDETASSPGPDHLASVPGIVFDVQRYSLHDGPGVRTNVFLKGCPLRCQWCANPESQARQPEPMVRAGQCIDCGLFEAESPAALLCPDCLLSWQGVRRSEAVHADIEARIAFCPTGALSWAGTRRTAGEVMSEVLRDRVFYGGGGGLTLTGGEPTTQPDFCEALLLLAKASGVTTAMETCGHAPWPVFERLLPHLDIVLFDIKHMDAERHRHYTGVDNTLILANARRLAAAGATLRIRVPLIPGFNAETADITAIAAFASSLPGPIAGVDVLPYHSMGKAKYAALGREYPWRSAGRLSESEVQAFAAIVAAYNLPVTVGG